MDKCCFYLHFTDENINKLIEVTQPVIDCAPIQTLVVWFLTCTLKKCLF